MNVEFFPPVQVWRLPTAALTDSLAELARDGRSGSEGIMLWVGQRRDGVAEVTHLVALRGAGIIKAPAFIRITPPLFNEVADVVAELDAVLVGQIHSHGVGYSTNLSPTDRTQGIAVPYYLSIVAPDYALRPATRLVECGVHVFEPAVGYRRLPAAEIDERIQLVPGAVVPVLTVGGAP